MSNASERGEVEVDLDGSIHSVQYEIGEIRDGRFKLTIWYLGKSYSERVPWYTKNPHDDVKMPHAPLLLGRLLKELEG